MDQESHNKPTGPVKWNLLLASSTLGLLLVCCLLAWQLLNSETIVQELPADNLSAREVSSLAHGLNDLFTPVPDPGVDMTFLPGLVDRPAWRTKVPLTTNSSGFRYPQEFEPKRSGTYRIVLLGDSFVAASHARYEDGVAPQMEGILQRTLQTRGDGSRPTIQVYPVAVSGWNIFSQLSYLIHNLHQIEPDLVIHTINANDFDSGFGFVLGNIRSSTYDPQPFFGNTHIGIGSPLIAARGSTPARSLIASYLIPESRNRFHTSAAEARRLKDLLDASNGNYLLYLFMYGFIAHGIQESFGSFVSPEETLLATSALTRHNLRPIDAHPNRIGYRYMALGLARYLHDHDYFQLDLEKLEEEGDYEAYSTLETRPMGKSTAESWFKVNRIPSRFRIVDGEFESEDSLRCIVGGIYKEGVIAPRAVLVLRRQGQQNQLKLALSFPEVPALQGGILGITVDSRKLTEIPMDRGERKPQEILIPLGEGPAGSLVEVVLEANRYYTDIYQRYTNGVFGPMPRAGKILLAELVE